MKRHRAYRVMLAAEDWFPVAERPDLVCHLATCAACRARARAYAEQAAACAPLRHGLPPAGLWDAVLAYADGQAVKGHRRRRPYSLRVVSCAGVLAMVVAAVAVNQPVSRVAANSSGDTTGGNRVSAPFRCDQDGIALLLYKEILHSPAEFDPGPRGQYLEPVGQEAAARLVHPIWYVAYGNSVDTGSCGDADITTVDTQVGFNPDNNTTLHVFGRLKNGIAPWWQLPPDNSTSPK